jgi:hypothetical protein
LINKILSNIQRREEHSRGGNRAVRNPAQFLQLSSPRFHSKYSHQPNLEGTLESFLLKAQFANEIQKLDVVVLTCNPSIWEAEAGRW